MAKKKNKKDNHNYIIIIIILVALVGALGIFIEIMRVDLEGEKRLSREYCEALNEVMGYTFKILPDYLELKKKDTKVAIGVLGTINSTLANATEYLVEEKTKEAERILEQGFEPIDCE